MAFSLALQHLTSAHEDEVAMLQAQIHSLETKLNIGHANGAQTPVSRGGVSEAVRQKPYKPVTPRKHNTPMAPCSATPAMQFGPTISNLSSLGHNNDSPSAKFASFSSYDELPALKRPKDLATRMDEFLVQQQSLMTRFEGVLQNSLKMCQKRTTNKRDTTAVRKAPLWSCVSSIDAELRKKAMQEGQKAATLRSFYSLDEGEDLTFFQSCRAKIFALVASSYFEFFFAVAILCSTSLLGWQVQYSASNLDHEVPLALEIADHSFSFLFLIELSLRVFAHGVSVFYDKDWFWYWLDLFIVISSLFEVTTSIVARGASGDSSMKTVAAFRAARIMRVARMMRALRVVRVISFIRALRTLVSSIIYTLHSLGWSLVLLTLIIYAFSLVFTQAYIDYTITHPEAETAEMERFWGTLGNSMTTLTQAITGGLSWEVAANEIWDIGSVYFLILLIYVAFASFAVLNTMTAVFCQSAMESAQRDTDLMIQTHLQNKAMYCEKLKELFTQVDDDDSGVITLDELEQCMNQSAVKALFDTMELQFDDAWALFKLLDSDKSGILEIDEFVEGCCRLRGSARRVDIAKLNHEIKNMRKKLNTLNQSLQYTLDDDIFDTYRTEKSQMASQKGSIYAGNHQSSYSALSVGGDGSRVELESRTEAFSMDLESRADAKSMELVFGPREPSSPSIP